MPGLSPNNLKPQISSTHSEVEKIGNRLVIRFPEPPTSASFFEAYEKIWSGEVGFGKVLVDFCEPVKFPDMKIPVSSRELSFFPSEGNNLCYSRKERPRSGYKFDQFLSKTIAISVLNPESSANIRNDKAEARIRKVLKNIHPNAWRDMQKEIANRDGTRFSQFTGGYSDGYGRLREVTGFSSYEMADISAFFDNPESLKVGEPDEQGKWHYYTGRHYIGNRENSIELSYSEKDGLKAWFSSEYLGCGNGDYYILINPTTAMFIEKD